jgi:hypothetical protein
VFLIRSRSEPHSQHFRKVRDCIPSDVWNLEAYRVSQILFRLIIITWEAAVPPCTGAIATLVACAVGVCVTLLKSEIRKWPLIIEPGIAPIRRQSFPSMRSCYRQSLESYILSRCSCHCTFPFLFLFLTQMTVSTISRREGRAAIATVVHRTHLTLTNASRGGAAWPDRPDNTDTDSSNPSKQDGLPVRPRFPPPISQSKIPLRFVLFIYLSISWRSYHTRWTSRAAQVVK